MTKSDPADPTHVYPVSETFYTIQGEGPSTGMPAFFIRLQYCPVGCEWCDTKYTWDKHKQSVPKLNSAAIYKRWQESEAPLIVITGGEPLYHDLCPLIHQFQLYQALAYEIETACVVKPTDWLDAMGRLSRVQFNCSPKLSSSNAKMLKESQEGITHFRRYSSTWKFVISHHDDLEEALELIDKHQLPRHQVYFMPQALTQEALQKCSLWLVEKCKKYKIKFTTRLHLQLWGARRGV